MIHTSGGYLGVKHPIGHAGNYDYYLESSKTIIFILFDCFTQKNIKFLEYHLDMNTETFSH